MRDFIKTFNDKLIKCKDFSTNSFNTIMKSVLLNVLKKFYIINNYLIRVKQRRASKMYCSKSCGVASNFYFTKSFGPNLFKKSFTS